jgi:hypothetical protein
MNAVFSAALLVAALAPWFEARAWGVPLSYVPLARMARTFLSAGAVTLLAGGLAWLALSQASVDLRATALAAGGVALCFGALVALASARRDRALRGLHVLTTQLGLPDRRDVAAARIDARLERLAAGDARQHALLTLFAAGPLTRHALGAQARRQLERIPPDVLAPPEAALRAQLRAMTFLHDGALEDATEALDAAPYPTTPAVDAWIDLTRALGQVVCGGVSSARELVAARSDLTQADPALAVQRDTIEAHALAAEGDEERARALLAALVARSGVGGLALALRPVGPATDLARAVVATHIAAP